MIQNIVIPKMGEGVTEITITKMVKMVGETVKIGETVAEMTTDKVDMEVISEFDGVIQEILAKENDVLAVGAVVMILEVAENSTVETPVLVIEKTTEKVVESPVLETEKTNSATFEKPVLQIEKSLEVIDNQLITPNVVKKIKGASPLARILARELSVDLARIKTDNDRILRSDVIAAFQEKSSLSVQTAFAGFKPKPLPDFSKFGTVERKKMTPMTLKTTENLQAAWSNIPHAWITEKVDISKIEALREQFTVTIGDKNRRLSLTIFIAKAVARVLRQPQFSVFNSSLDTENKEIIYKDFINIGIAVDTEHGLLVPVVRDCDVKGLEEIALEFAALTDRTRNKKNTPNDLQGGTFTISNVGGIGGAGIFPIVNAPEVAILGIAAAHTEGVWCDDKKVFEPRLMMPITIGFDHRIINGAAATRFVVEVKRLLEEPFLMQMR